MNSVSTLSRQYKSLQQINKDFCDAVMLIKKRQLLSDEAFKKQHPDIKITLEEWQEAYTEVDAFLNDIKNINDEDFESNYIPYSALENFKQKIKKEIDLFDKKIINLSKDIQNEEIVTDEGFSFLNKIISILDLERKMTFRQLRNRRRRWKLL